MSHHHATEKKQRVHRMDHAIQVLLGLATIGFAASAGPLPLDEAFKDFGFPVALVLFFVWNTWKREERIANRVTQLETFNQNELLTINKQAIRAIGDNTEALHSMAEALKNRPCLCEGPDLLGKIEAVAARVDQMAKHTAAAVSAVKQRDEH